MNKYAKFLWFFTGVILTAANLYIGFHGKINPVNLIVAGYCIGFLLCEWLNGFKYD